MDHSVYSLRDLKGEFLGPRVSPNEQLCRRDFAMLVNSGDGPMSFAPEDFELYYLGEFDGKTGIFSPCKVPEFICRGSDLVGVNYEK